MRNITLHIFCSVKGGVGKSTLAVVAAKLLASQGRAPVLLDTDVLGSSLADGLDLCAPRMVEIDGGLDYEAGPTRSWYDLAETRELREFRKLSSERVGSSDGGRIGGSRIPYVNDALFYPSSSSGRDCRVDAMLWQHAKQDGVFYLPSSPLREDARRAIPFVLATNEEFAWTRRLAWVIDALVHHASDVSDVILDLPPGTWGIAHEALVFGSRLRDALPPGFPQWHKSIAWEVNPSLVTTPDRNDRVLAIEYWLATRKFVPELRVLLNRNQETVVNARALLRYDLPVALQGLGAEEDVLIVPFLSSTLGKMFVEGDMSLSQDVREMSNALRLRKDNAHG